jgi:hypothetical protein
MQVQRRLVKSPPELWAEISDDDALARRLAEFGPIAITRVEPETKVAWEGEHASGTVELTASGWGTQVLLTAEPLAAPEPEPDPEPERARRPLRVLLRWRRPRAEPPPDPAGPPGPRVDTEAVLTGVLDDLGAAHHRPFSRS